MVDQAMMRDVVVLALTLVSVLFSFAVWLESRRTNSLVLRFLDGEPVPALNTKPFNRAQAIESAKRVAAQPPVDPSFGKLRPVEVTPSSEDTPLSPLTPDALAALRAEHESLWLPRVDEDGRPVVVPMQPREYRGEMPALGEDEERGWTPPKSGTLTREGR